MADLAGAIASLQAVDQQVIDKLQQLADEIANQPDVNSAAQLVQNEVDRLQTALDTGGDPPPPVDPGTGTGGDTPPAGGDTPPAGGDTPPTPADPGTGDLGGQPGGDLPPA